MHVKKFSSDTCTVFVCDFLVSGRVVDANESVTFLENVKEKVCACDVRVLYTRMHIFTYLK